MTEHQIYHFSHADIWLAAHPQYEIFGLYHSPGITELGDSDHLRGMDGDLCFCSFVVSMVAYHLL